MTESNCLKIARTWPPTPSLIPKSTPLWKSLVHSLVYHKCHKLYVIKNWQHFQEKKIKIKIHFSRSRPAGAFCARFDPVRVENLMLTDCGVLLVFNAPTLVS